jgi:hypothetical protein
MRVRMLTTVAGYRDDGSSYVHEAGAEYDLPADEAQDYLARPDDMPRAEPVAVKAAQRAEKRTSRRVAAAETR